MADYGSLIDEELSGRPKARTAPQPSYGALIDDEMGTAAAAQLHVANSGNPDQAARARVLAGQTKLPVETVQRNLPDIESSVRLAQQRKALKDDPLLAVWAALPGNAAIAIDDFSVLPKAAKPFRDMAADIRARREGREAMVDAMRPDPTLYSYSRGIGRSVIEAGNKVGNTTQLYLADMLGLENEQNRLIDERRLIDDRVQATTPTFKSRVASSLYSGVSSTAQALPGILGAVATGGASLPLTLAGGLTFSDAYGRYRARGGSAGEALTGATAEAGVEVATEALPVKFLVDSLGKVGFGRFMSGFLGRDMLGEQIATLAQDAIDTAIANPDKSWRDYANERLGAAADSALAVVAMGGAIAPLQLAADYDARRARIAEAERHGAFLDQLGRVVAESKTRQRDPSAFAKFLELHADGTPVDRVYVPAEAVQQFYQSQGLDWQSSDDPFFGAFQDDFADQMRQGLLTGGDVVVSTSGFAAHLAGTPAWDALRDDVRLSPDAMSAREARDAAAAFGDALQQSGQDFAAQIERDRAAMEPSTKVFEDVVSKARQAGFTLEAAQRYADLFSARYEARGARLGTDAWSAYQQSGIEITQVLPEAVAKVVAADGLDILIGTMRRGANAPTDRQLYGTSLLEWIANRGGIEDSGGELAAMDADKWHRAQKFRRKLVREAKVDQGPGLLGDGAVGGIGFSPDDIAQAAWEEGFFPDFPERPSINDLMAAIDRELRGQPVYRPTEMGDLTTTGQMRQAADELREILSRAGVDADTATDGEIRQAVAAYQAEAMGVSAPSYSQQGETVVALEGDQLAAPDVPIGRLRTSAQDYYRRTLQPSAGVVTTDGLTVRFNRTGRMKSTAKGDRLLRALPAVPHILERGRLLETRPGNRPGVISVRFYGGFVDIDGERVALVVAVRETTSGAFQYDLSFDTKGGAEGRLDKRAEGGSVSATGPASKQPSDTANIGDVPVSRKLDQPDAGQGPRGRITFEQGRSIIELFEGRDLSTLAHEAGHLWLEELRADAALPDAPQQLRDDWALVEAWFAANGQPIGADGVIPVEAHELWARGIERYLMEGKAPSSGLRRAFDAFRSWLLTIYQVVANLRAPISPEIRGVMDRLLATDEAIAAADAEAESKLLFKTAAEAGMTDAEFAAYLQAAGEARGEAYDALLYRTMMAVRKARTKEWKSRERSVRDEVSGRIDALPVFRALKMLRAARDTAGAVKLSRAALVDSYGEDALALLPRGVPPIYSETGVHPDVAAEMVGMSGGDELVKALIGLERQQRELKAGGDKRSVRRAMIEAETAQIMGERFGDPLADGSIEEEARAAIHSDIRGSIIASEARQLARRSGSKPTPYKLARDWARRTIAGKSVRDGATPAALNRYLRAEAKAGRDAEKAMLAGDVDEAFRQKQAQLLNHALYAEAKAAQELVDSAVKRLGKLAKRRTSPSIDQDYMDQVHALLERYDFKPASQRTLERRQSLAEWAEARRAQGYDVDVPAKLLVEAGRHNFLTLSVEELLGLRQTVDQIVHLGRLKQTLIDAQEQREFEAVVDEAVAQTDELPQREPSDLMAPDLMDRFRAGVAGFDSSLLKIETVVDWLDGGRTDGVFNRIVFRPIAEAQDRANDRFAAMVEKLNAALAEVPAEQLKRWADKVTAPELINAETGRPWVLTRQQLIAMALNTGNEGNLQRLVDGYRWTEEGVMRALSRELSAEEWRYVQSVWDTIDELWPDIAALEKRINGVEPDRVEARPVMTPHGELRGGYYPAIYDSSKDYRAEEFAGQDKDLFSAGYTRASTRSSATKSRAEQVKRPILLNIGVITRHVGEVVHDLAFREAIINADKFLSAPRVMAAIDRTLGPEVRKQFRPWLKFVANQWAMERAGNEGVAGFMNRLRANATIVGMGFRISTIMMQAAGYSNSFEVVGAKWVAPALARAVANPVAAFDFVMERSGEIRHRMDTLDRDIDAAARRLAGSIGRLSDIKRFAFHGIGYMDRVVVIPTWLGAYEKALAGGASEADAIYAADKAVRQSQGAGAAKDLAAVARGTGPWGQALKLMTMFYSYLSAVYQRQRTLGRDVRRAKPRDFPALMARAWWLVVVPPILGELLAGRGPDDDEDWGWWSAKLMMFQALGPIPMVRDLGRPIWDRLTGAQGFDYQLSPIQNAGTALVRVAGDVGRVVRGEETTRATRNVLEAVGYWTGLIPGQVAAAAQFLVDVGQGEQDPETFAEWWEGLTTGRIKED